MCNLQAYIDELNEKLAKVSRERDDLARMIKEQAVPVVHGRWVHDGQRIHNGVDWWHCSECNTPATGVEIKYNFCPNCGAKMNGGEDA